VTRGCKLFAERRVRRVEFIDENGGGQVCAFASRPSRSGKNRPRRLLAALKFLRIVDSGRQRDDLTRLAEIRRSSLSTQARAIVRTMRLLNTSHCKGRRLG
jgi:hypothetical protein